MTGKAACSKFAAYSLLLSKFRSVLLSSGLSIHFKKKIAAGVWLVLTFFSNENWSEQTFFPMRTAQKCILQTFYKDKHKNGIHNFEKSLKFGEKIITRPETIFHKKIIFKI